MLTKNSAIFIRRAVATAALSLGIALSIPTSQATAAFFNFEALATSGAATGGNPALGVGEGNWSILPTVGDVFTVDGIGVTASASGVAASRAYLDGPSGGKPAGLGVCSLTGSCAGTSDDNVGRAGDTAAGVFESLILTFTSEVKITDLNFRNRDHDPLNGSLNINGNPFTITAGDAGVLNLIGTVFTFARIAGDAINRDFYLSGVTAFLNPPGGGGEVPLPPAALLFGSVLAGGGLLARWKKKRTAAA